jgi:hypothetical protein
MMKLSLVIHLRKTEELRIRSLNHFLIFTFKRLFVKLTNNEKQHSHLHSVQQKFIIWINISKTFLCISLFQYFYCVFKRKLVSCNSNWPAYIKTADILSSTRSVFENKNCKCRKWKVIWWNSERGSSSQNSSAEISTAWHFFWICQLLNRKTSTAWQTKVWCTCSPFCFQAVNQNFEQMTKYLWQ